MHARSRSSLITANIVDGIGVDHKNIYRAFHLMEWQIYRICQFTWLVFFMFVGRVFTVYTYMCVYDNLTSKALSIEINNISYIWENSYTKREMEKRQPLVVKTRWKDQSHQSVREIFSFPICEFCDENTWSNMQKKNTQNIEAKSGMSIEHTQK